MTVLDVLSSPEKWCQYAYARTANGDGCPHDNPFAVSWCFAGAIRRCHGEDKTYEIAIYFHNRFGKTIADWNDATERTYNDVVQMATELGI